MTKLSFVSENRPDIKQAEGQSGLVKAWSFTTLMKFLECPYQIYLKNIEKRVGRPQADEANRGENLHKVIEDFVRGELDTLPSKIKNHRDQIIMLKMLYEKGIVMIEDDWGFTVNWESTGWMDKDIWARVKLDAMVRENETSARIIDWKSGKKYGNEAKHKRQGQIYAIAAFIKFPELEFVSVEFRYIDLGTDNILLSNYSREQAMRMFPQWNAKALEMTTTVVFKAKPTMFNCRFCDFNQIDSEYLCPYGVRDF